MMVRSIYSPKVAQHKNPVPNAAIHHGMFITSAILGKELDTDTYPQDKAHQIELVFRYLVTILNESGAEPDDVIKLDLYFADKEDRVLANPHWLRLWPDPRHRPARQAHETVLPKGCCFQIVATGVVLSPNTEISSLYFPNTELESG